MPFKIHFIVRHMLVLEDGVWQVPNPFRPRTLQNQHINYLRDTKEKFTPTVFVINMICGWVRLLS